jgi:hypothetical protein
MVKEKPHRNSPATSDLIGRPRLLPGMSVASGFMLHPFDLKHGVRTSGLIAGRHLANGHRHDRHATAYYGIAPSVFHSLVRRWRRSRPAASIEQTTFVDIGAGMGRAMLLAAEMPFKEVVGVELNSTLVRAAQKNLTICRNSSRVLAAMRIVDGDAVGFVFPPGVCVAFMFNPFGPPVMRRMLDSMARQFRGRAGELDLLYVNNEQEHVIDQRAGFGRLFLGKVKRSRPDAVADRNILDNQPEGEYASAPYEDCSIWRWMGSGR